MPVVEVKKENAKVKLMTTEQWEETYRTTIKNVIAKASRTINSVNNKKLNEEQNKKVRHAGIFSSLIF